MSIFGKQAEGVVFEHMGDASLIVDVEQNRMIRLNRTAAYIWRCCDALSAEQIAAQWVRAAHCEIDRVKSDVENCLTLLSEQGWLIKTSRPHRTVLFSEMAFDGSYDPPAFHTMPLSGNSRGRPSPRGVSGPV